MSRSEDVKGRGADARVPVVPANTLDEKKVLFMKGLLSASVERLTHIRGALPIRHRHFNKYTINMDEPPFAETSFWKFYNADHQDFADRALVAKMSDGEHDLRPDSLHIKVLNLLGKKHPHIIQTWDVFHNPENNQIIVFQEMANHGSLDKYLELNRCDQLQAGLWLSQIFKGLEYLWNVALCHRAIKPKHLLIAHSDLRIKIGGFELATVYWDPEKESKIIDCFSAITRSTTEASFQPPDSYGNESRRRYDPLSAEIWSVGAVFFYIFTQCYPYNWMSNDPNAISQIQTNVDQIQGLSAEGKKLMSEMLKPMAAERITFERIQDNPWLKTFK